MDIVPQNLESKPDMFQIVCSFPSTVNDLATRLSVVNALSEFESLVQEIDDLLIEAVHILWSVHTFH